MSKIERQETLAKIAAKATKENDELAELKKLCIDQLNKILELKKLIEQH